jgi:hypothetical protein
MPEVAKELLKQAHYEHSKFNSSGEESRLKNKVYALQSQLSSLSERLSEIPIEVDATPIYNQMKKIGNSKKDLEERILLLRRENQSHELPAELSDYLSFLRLLKGSGVIFGPVERFKIISQLIDKVELLPDGMKIHYFVGTSRIKKGTDKTVPSLNIADRCSTSLTNGGDMRDRTADLFTASEALSQLSYAPKMK